MITITWKQNLKKLRKRERALKSLQYRDIFNINTDFDSFVKSILNKFVLAIFSGLLSTTVQVYLYLNHSK